MARPNNDGRGRMGGRKKGTPNKDKIELLAKAQELGVDPFEVLLLFAKGDWKALGYDSEKYVASESDHGSIYKWTIEPSVRAKCASEACQYLYAKRKAIEHSGEINNPSVGVSQDDLEERLKQLKGE
jgi:hypothetical protein